MKSINDTLDPEIAYWRDRRKAAIKNLADPKVKLSGTMRRQLTAQLNRDTKAYQQPPLPAEVKLAKKFGAASVFQLAKWFPRVRLSLAKVQEAYTKAGEMGKIKLQQLLHPRLAMLGIVKNALMREVQARYVRAIKKISV